jgi:alpha-L-rhamnosidase
LASTILGLRPGAPGFTRVNIRPQLGRLQAASGSIPHPAGRIGIRLQRVGNAYDASITLPPGLTATVICSGCTTTLSAPESRCRIDV